MTRTWPYPDLRNGVTLHHITDTHFGVEDGISGPHPWLLDWFARYRDDIENLKIAVTGGHLHTGDMINSWFGAEGATNGEAQTQIDDQTSEYTAWRDAIKASDGLPFAEAVGNHDMFGGYQGDQTGGVMITADQWASSLGLSTPNNVYDMRDVRMLTVAPDSWMGVGAAEQPFVLTEATLDWLDAELSSDARPALLAAHVPPQSQYPNDPLTLDAANPRLADIIGAHTNIIGIMSGHRHNGIDDADAFTTVTIAGRKLFAVCGEGGGGGWVNGGGAWSGGQFGHAQVFSSYMTLLDENTLDIRWRDHLTCSWVRRSDGVSHLLLSRT